MAGTIPTVSLTKTAVIPAHNEVATIADVVARTIPYVDQVIVIDDGSSDDTVREATGAGAAVISLTAQGYVNALTAGLKAAIHSDLIITLDADGEHLPKLIRPIEENRCDVVFGQLPVSIRRSEQLIEWIVCRRIGVMGTASGFRAIRSSMVYGLQIKGDCTCGLLPMKLYLNGARICSVPVSFKVSTDKRNEHWSRHAGLLPELFRLMMTRR